MLRRNQAVFALTAFCCCLLQPWAARAQSFDELKAENWHHWRGPAATGVSKTAKPPVSWGEDRNVQWKVALPGNGTSTPIIW